MRSLFFLTLALLCTSVGYAQTFERAVDAHTETSFGIPAEDIWHRHIVSLRNNQEMIIELTDVTDYLLLHNFDSVLKSALDDVAFYKDSVGALEHVRIDYDIKLGSYNVLMRFRRHQPNEHIYVKRNGNIAAMKTDRDTFRIIIRKPLPDRHRQAFFYSYPVQVTFIMNNYTELYNVLADHGLLTQSIDTLKETMVPKEYSPNLQLHQSFARYEPYSYNKPLHKTQIDLEHTHPSGMRKKRIAALNAAYTVHLK